MKVPLLGMFVAFLAMFSSFANAALPTGVSGGLSSIQSDMLALVDLVWPVVIASVAAIIIFKLFKRFANKI
jgi:uncharacterized membrane protein